MDRADIIQRITTNMESTKRVMQAEFYRAVDESGLGLSQGHLLMLVKQMQPIQLKDLASKMYLTPGAITQAIETLAREGYLDRVHADQDRRSVFVSLTDKGETVVSRLRQTLQQHFTAILATLNDDELQLYHEVQLKLLAHLEQRTADKTKGGIK